MGRFGEAGTLPDQFMAAAAQGAVDRTRNRKKLPAAGCRLPGGDQGAASARGFDHQGAEAHARYDAVPLRKMPASRRSAQREPADQSALLPDLFGQSNAAPRVDDIDARPQDGNGDPLRGEGAPVRRAVDA